MHLSLFLLAIYFNFSLHDITSTDIICKQYFHLTRHHFQWGYFLGNKPETCIDRTYMYVQLIQSDFGNSDKESDYDKDKANIPFHSNRYAYLSHYTIYTHTYRPYFCSSAAALPKNAASIDFCKMILGDNKIHTTSIGGAWAKPSKQTTQGAQEVKARMFTFREDLFAKYKEQFDKIWICFYRR